MSMRIRSCALMGINPSDRAFNTRIALRTSCPQSWLMTASNQAVGKRLPRMLGHFMRRRP
jgi:hypothetical protein